VRGQLLSELRRATTNPNAIASREWWAAAFPGHPYAWPVNGTLETVAAITRADLASFARRVLIVGNVDRAAAGAIVDHIFGDLPEKADLVDVPAVQPRDLGRKIMVNLDVAQSVVMVGGEGLARNDPDFMAAYVLNHILGGGSFSSRLYREVREVRGLAYSVYSGLMPLDHAALFIAGTATRADRAGQTLEVVESEIRRMAASGPTEEELASAKSYLKGSFALRFDTSSKIAGQLVQIQLDNLGIDYIVKRNSLVDAVTLDDVKRVAKRLFGGGMLVAIVGRTQEPQAAPGAQITPELTAKKGEGG
jgi:zinc protease